MPIAAGYGATSCCTTRLLAVKPDGFAAASRPTTCTGSSAPCSAGVTAYCIASCALPVADATPAVSSARSVCSVHVPDDAPVLPGITNGSGTPAHDDVFVPCTHTNRPLACSRVALTDCVAMPAVQSTDEL